MAWLSRMGLARVPGTILPTHIVGGSSLPELRKYPDSDFILAHVPAGYDLSGFVVATVFRDPRNVLVSYRRHREREGVAVSLCEALEDFWGAPFVPLYRDFLGWRGRSIAFRYEDMPPEQVGDGAGIYAEHDRDWNTRTGSPSDWPNVWDAETDKAWVAAGGPQLLADAGYAQAPA